MMGHSRTHGTEWVLHKCQSLSPPTGHVGHTYGKSMVLTLQRKPDDTFWTLFCSHFAHGKLEEN